MALDKSVAIFQVAQGLGHGRYFLKREVRQINAMVSLAPGGSGAGEARPRLPLTLRRGEVRELLVF
ncbi:hypothetical protein DCJ80_25385 [Salmonella enterica subsp. enterica serovar Kentucky]|nr:hypothetical protein [Salmonella enterica subsp. enterica serovar Kentucky]